MRVDGGARGIWASRSAAMVMVGGCGGVVGVRGVALFRRLHDVFVKCKREGTCFREFRKGGDEREGGNRELNEKTKIL